MITLTHIFTAAYLATMVNMPFYPDKVIPKTPLTKRLESVYDYIIVGGGSAGALLASRLSEDSDVTVLLLEAGGDDRGQDDLAITYNWPTLATSEFDWEYKSDSEPKFLQSLKNQQYNLPSGKVLGGSGSISGGLYVRGNRQDYERWANYLNDSSWDYSHVLPYFMRSEGAASDPLMESAYHKTDGPIKVRQEINSQPITYTLGEAAEELGIPVNPDYNGQSQEGFGHFQHNVNEKSVRSSSSSAFLHSVIGRENLHVGTHSHVTKINFGGTRAVSVNVVFKSRKMTIEARREIILSAGAYGTPHLLMLSGVGPKEQLESLGIPVIADLPVGQNLQTHFLVDYGVSIEQPVSYPATEPSLKEWIEYQLFGTGRFVTSDDKAALFKSTNEEARSLQWPDVELILVESPESSLWLYGFNYNERDIEEVRDQLDNVTHGFVCLPLLLRPEVVGEIKLRSTDPFDYPNITIGVPQSQKDLDSLVAAIDLCHQLVNTSALQAVGAKMVDTSGRGVCKDLPYGSREEQECAILQRSNPAPHPVGTAKMGPAGDPTAVVDPQLLVHGLQGLRVVDASVMPWVTSGHTNAPVVMIAEKGADLIRGRTPPVPLTAL